ncbi:MBL fold metallo-hydrolase [Pseudodesulfovibrio sediminis]|uniref:MBL fold metallo-hydrolase n=1 Tax=Pseudodesulfovibrio sediminis TaxID=2810563 RepID=A0ABM7P4E2_9BACT|nr:MBL fold metallo-hydrolase [Pseudodesulfovibrio sediminis]BCS87741.1 MBL fold metallo-hydrolase [Pseudodesulfovibrio sediminis]
MRFQFRGTRGSLAAPGPDTVKYGGNTTCIEIRSDNGDIIILDAGTGIRSLGVELAQQMSVKCHLFVSHTHWDHIQGVPFFVPMFVSGNELIIYGPPDPLTLNGIETVLAKQMEYPHFPVGVAELQAEISYETLSVGQTVDLGFARVSTLLMNHPAMNFGFRVECDGKTLFYTGDHEPFSNIYSPGEESYADYETVVRDRSKEIVDFIRGADVLIADAQYTDEEYVQKKGWGHSTFSQTLQLAREAEVGMTYLTHHDISRTDDEVDAIYARLQQEWQDAGPDFEMAREGVMILVG